MPKSPVIERCNSSMQLTRAADYAVRVMIYLAALPQGARASLVVLAIATATPESFLSKVLQGLAHGGLISSHRGQAGGFQISPLGQGCSMRDVIEAIDGPMSLNVCLNVGRPCTRKSWCPAHPIWVKAQNAVLAVLDGARIADLAKDETVVDICARFPLLSERQPSPAPDSGF
jgi:Rrf2 family protein